MAGCSDIDQSVNMPPTSKKPVEPCSNAAPSLTFPECVNCLQTCVYPVSLPCKHVFCYLCVKGVFWPGKQCALCLQEIPEDFLDKQSLLSPEESASRGRGEYTWYYKGTNDWWQYDECASRELEDAYTKGKKKIQIPIAGILYEVDLENKVQYQHNEQGRRREIKRDLSDIPKKGVAGIRTYCEPASLSSSRESSADGADSNVSHGAATLQPPNPASVIEPLTSVSGQPTSTSIETAFALLQLNPERPIDWNHRVEGEEDRVESSVRVSSPDVSVEETESDPSSDVSADPWAHISSVQQRLLNLNQGHIVQDRSSTGSGPPRASVGSRRPDGECAVTEV